MRTYSVFSSSEGDHSMEILLSYNFVFILDIHFKVIFFCQKLYIFYVTLVLCLGYRLSCDQKDKEYIECELSFIT